VALLGPIGIQLNRNGTAIVALFTTHQLEAGGAEPLVQGQLMRWVGDTISRLGQPSSEGLVPVAVDCAATTIAGRTYHPTDPMRWSTTGGFATLPPAAPGSVTAGGQYEVMGVSPDGATAFGTYTVAGAPVVVLRWQGGAAETLFTLPDAGAKVTAFSRDGSTLLGETGAGQAFVRPLSGASSTLPFSGIENATAISADGAVVAGLFPAQSSDNQAVRAFVWSAGNGLQTLPEYTVITAITPNRVAVGYMTGSQPSADLDLVWDANHGVRRLRDILASHGVTAPADVTLFSTHAISDDARVIVSYCSDASDPESMHLCRAVLPANAFD
jgi:hypothetical protein